MAPGHDKFSKVELKSTQARMCCSCNERSFGSPFRLLLLHVRLQPKCASASFPRAYHFGLRRSKGDAPGDEPLAEDSWAQSCGKATSVPRNDIPS